MLDKWSFEGNCNKIRCRLKFNVLTIECTVLGYQMNYLALKGGGLGEGVEGVTVRMFLCWELLENV